MCTGEMRGRDQGKERHRKQRKWNPNPFREKERKTKENKKIRDTAKTLLSNRYGERRRQ